MSILSDEDKMTVLNSLRDFVVRVLSDTDNRTPEEIHILPAITKILLDENYLLELPKK